MAVQQLDGGIAVEYPARRQGLPATLGQRRVHPESTGATCPVRRKPSGRSGWCSPSDSLPPNDRRAPTPPGTRQRRPVAPRWWHSPSSQRTWKRPPGVATFNSAAGFTRSDSAPWIALTSAFFAQFPPHPLGDPPWFRQTLGRLQFAAFSRWSTEENRLKNYLQAKFKKVFTRIEGAPIISFLC